MNHSSQRARISEVRKKMHALEGPTARSAQRADEIIARFELFLEPAFDIEFVTDITAPITSQVRAR